MNLSYGAVVSFCSYWQKISTSSCSIIFRFLLHTFLPMRNPKIKSSRANRLKIVKHELVRDRGPPPPPTPLQFPQSTFDPGQARPYTSREIYQLFTTIHKTRPKLDPLQALSVQSIEVGLEQLLPEGYLPDASWNQDPSVANHVVLAPVDRTPSATLGNGTAAPGHDAWYKSAKELLHDNDDVFKYLRGTLQSSPDRPKLRVAMFRKFWDHLRELSMYWDTRNEKYEDVSGEAATLASAPAPDAMDIDKTSAANQPTEETKNGKAKQTYTGNRIGTGREMPPVYREDVICAFVETVAMAFHCRIERPPIAPKLKMQNILIPVPQAGIVYRCPNDRLKARRGILEGPLLAVQCNHNTAFRRQEEATVKEKEPDDKGQDEAISLLREVGSMLNLAQKRAREGQEEPIPGEEQWWVTKPRWGGGSGGAVPSKEVPNGHAPDDDDDDPEGSNKGVKRASKGAKPLTAAAKRAKRLYAMENWKKLNPGPRRWDRGVVHLQIGKDQGATGDDVG